MKIELDNQLCSKYPLIFAERNQGITESGMYFGFQHGDGWYHILDAMCANIQRHIDHVRSNRAMAQTFNKALEEAKAGNPALIQRYYGVDDPQKITDPQRERIARALQEKPRKVIKECPQVVAVQVKEKFGTLRFYYDGGDDYVLGVVNMAESLSACTCEVCGNHGKITGNGWLSVRCVEHTNP